MKQICLELEFFVFETKGKYWNNLFCFPVGAGVLQAFTPHTLPAHSLGLNALQKATNLTGRLVEKDCTDIGSHFYSSGDNEECKALFKVTAYQGFFMELIVTMVFVLLILNVTEERNGPQW